MTRPDTFRWQVVLLAAMTLDLYGHLFLSGLDDVATKIGGLFV